MTLQEHQAHRASLVIAPEVFCKFSPFPHAVLGTVSQTHADPPGLVPV